MLYRFFDNAIYDDGDREPYTTLWIEAISPNEACERATALLALIWQVPPNCVCVQAMGKSEDEIFHEATEDECGGDRRLWATGSAGSRGCMVPLYSAQRVILGVSAGARTRLLAAWREAQQHAVELAAMRDAEAQALRDAGNEREAESRDWDAERYRAFASADLI